MRNDWRSRCCSPDRNLLFLFVLCDCELDLLYPECHGCTKLSPSIQVLLVACCIIWVCLNLNVICLWRNNNSFSFNWANNCNIPSFSQLPFFFLFLFSCASLTSYALLYFLYPFLIEPILSLVRCWTSLAYKWQLHWPLLHLILLFILFLTFCCLFSPIT